MHTLRRTVRHFMGDVGIRKVCCTVGEMNKFTQSIGAIRYIITGFLVALGSSVSLISVLSHF